MTDEVQVSQDFYDAGYKDGVAAERKRLMRKANMMTFEEWLKSVRHVNSGSAASLHDVVPTLPKDYSTLMKRSWDAAVAAERKRCVDDACHAIEMACAHRGGKRDDNGVCYECKWAVDAVKSAIEATE